MIASQQKIDELQTAEADKLVRDKLLKAFRRVGRPLFVEHTGLYLDHINGLPGGLTQVFWDAFERRQICGALSAGWRQSTCNCAHGTPAYSDARTIEIFEGELRGKIVPEPRGPREFQWDCVFMPDGHD